MIRFRRLNDPRRPFCTVLVAYEKAEDGRFYFSTETVSREFLRDVIGDYGVGALRRFWAALRAELAAEVTARQTSVSDETQAIDLYIPRYPRTYERVCEMLGVEPKRRETA